MTVCQKILELYVGTEIECFVTLKYSSVSISALLQALASPAFQLKLLDGPSDSITDLKLETSVSAA